MFNFTDTETSDPKQQRVCQLAAILSDEQGNELHVLNTLIRPDGWEISDYFTNEIHGITTDMCWERGRPMREVLEEYVECIAKRAKKTIAHNLKFDTGRVQNELVIYGFHDAAKSFAETPGFCTMLGTTSICCIPNKTGRAGYKWPKLKEAHKHFFGAEFENQHDALADNRACKRIYFHLHNPPPVVPSPAASIESKPVVAADDDWLSPGTPAL